MKQLINKTILMVIAHPDDEIIFGWPIFQNPTIKKKILCCSSDLNNPERVWCKHRKNALQKVCEIANGEKLICLDYNSEFYRLPTRNEDLKKMSRNVVDNIEKMDPFDYIYTHNFWGEYGHLDHILINNICFSLKRDIIVSDMFVKSNWLCYNEPPNLFKKNIEENEIVRNINIDISLFPKYEKIYRDAGVWTWSSPINVACNLSLFKTC